ncbi:DUF3592 domain-containing protein [Nocardioides jejuensis]|uniref:DUF3592 domain-containing protein n=1 Tax=Nocardioides jejuensis TaxID=2502782 RepID=UPI00140542A0|nr:DUF3592 domain-containing protein [Nocardioides jejuensis]
MSRAREWGEVAGTALVSLALILGAVLAGYTLFRDRAHAEGSVIRRTMFHCVVEFRTASGQTVRFESSSGKGFDCRDAEVGDPVAVRYDPAHPAKATTSTASALWGLLVFGTIAGPLLGAVSWSLTRSTARTAHTT